MSRVASSSDQHSWHARLGCAPPACLAFLHCATHPPIPPLHPCTPAAGLGVDEYCEGASELESGSELSEDEQSCGGTSSGSDGGSAPPEADPPPEALVQQQQQQQPLQTAAAAAAGEDRWRSAAGPKFK